MYGVDWITPPKSPPTSVARPFGRDDLPGRIIIARRRRLSVQSMPPTTVASASGIATGR